MPRLTRYLQKVFGLNASAVQIKKFGSLAAGTPANATDPEEIQSLSQYLSGWFDAVLGGNSPTIEDMNALCHLFGYQLSYLMESGIPEWNSLTTYYTGNIVNVGGKIYVSISDTSLNNLVTDSEFWIRYSDIPKNCILSGKTRSTSDQSQFITPNGAAASFILEGLTKNLVTNINGVISSVSTNETESGLTLGPSTTPTCWINESTAADQDDTRIWGEYRSEKETLTVDTMGAEMQSFIGEYKIIKIAGVATEYALAFIKSTTELTNIYRGYLYDSAGAPVNRTAFTNNDVITVLSTAHVFVDVDGTTIDVIYTTPVKSATEPSSPAADDYWQDLSTEAKSWYKYNGASYDLASKAYVGIVGIDSANCVCARSGDFFADHDSMNSIITELDTVAIVKIKNPNAQVSVYGEEFNFGIIGDQWSMVDSLAIAADMYNATEQASTIMYNYVSNKGELIFSDISPHYRPDLKGAFHPHNPWRCVSQWFNDSGSDFDTEDTNYFMDSKYNKNVLNVIDETIACTVTSGTPIINEQSENGPVGSMTDISVGHSRMNYRTNYYFNTPSVQATTSNRADDSFAMVGSRSVSQAEVSTDRDNVTKADDNFDATISKVSYDRVRYAYWAV